jgi:hypothetical protein
MAATIAVTRVLEPYTEGYVSAPGEPLFQVKVRRLASPFFKNAFEHVHVEPPASLSASSSSSDGASLDAFGYAPSLYISSALGTVYRGENFRACISIYHSSKSTIKDCSISVSLQSSANHSAAPSLLHSLIDTGLAAPFDFASGTAKDFVVTQRLLESGEYSVICCIRYADNGAPQSFNRSFRLLVADPLSFSSVHKADGFGNVVVQACITNKMSNSIVIEKLTLDAGADSTAASAFSSSSSSSFSSSSTSSSTASPSSVSSLCLSSPLPSAVDGPQALLKPNESQAYLFTYAETTEQQQHQQQQQLPSPRIFSLHWRSQLGETGIMRLPVELSSARSSVWSAVAATPESAGITARYAQNTYVCAFI